MQEHNNKQNLFTHAKDKDRAIVVKKQWRNKQRRKHADTIWFAVRSEGQHQLQDTIGVLAVSKSPLPG